MGLSLYFITRNNKNGFEKEVGHFRKLYNLHNFLVDSFGNGEEDGEEIILSLENCEEVRDLVKSLIDNYDPFECFDDDEECDDLDDLEEVYKFFSNIVLKLKNNKDLILVYDYDY